MGRHLVMAGVLCAAASSAWALSDAGQIGWRVQAQGPASARQLTLVTLVPQADRGRQAEHFIAARIGAQWYCLSAGWQVCGNTFPAWSSGSLPDRLTVALGTVDTAALRGTRVYAGYGTSFDEMLAAGRYRQVYTVGTAQGVAWQPTQTVPAPTPAYLAFNNTAVALRDATGTLHLVWGDTAQGYHGRHDGTDWQVTNLPKMGSGTYGKPTLAELPDGELLLGWSETALRVVSIHVTRSVGGRTRWEQPITLASAGGLGTAVALSAFDRGEGSAGALVAWNDEAGSRVLTRSWDGRSWSVDAWSAAASPAAGDARPKDVAVGGSGLVQWAVWEDTRAGGASEIYLARSSDGGLHWGLDTPMPAVYGNSIGGDPSLERHPDGTFTLGWQRRGRIYAAQLNDAAAVTGSRELGPGLFAHVAVNSRGALAVTWEHFAGSYLQDDSGKSVGNAIGLDGLAGAITPHAMPDSDRVLSAVQAAVALSADRIDVFWVDVSTEGQRQLRWRSGSFTD